MLENEFEYYRDHQIKLFEKYGRKYIVIVGQEVIGYYDSEIEAYIETKKTHSVGTFLIQLCSDDPDEGVRIFHFRVFPLSSLAEPDIDETNYIYGSSS
ncbi:MAG: hypothetical protein JSU85_05815 [Candidatus Zixiibacteriota bacterium]|nr:MAG: hypothetical protein JSU85_05815 [candidate division Zixibacteria bacterium]